MQNTLADVQVLTPSKPSSLHTCSGRLSEVKGPERSAKGSAVAVVVAACDCSWGFAAEVLADGDLCSSNEGRV